MVSIKIYCQIIHDDTNVLLMLFDTQCYATYTEIQYDYS